MKTKRPLSLTLASLFLVLALLTQLAVPLILGARLAAGGSPPRQPAGNPDAPTAPGRRVTGMPGSRFLGGVVRGGSPGALAGAAIALLAANAAAGIGALVAAVGLWRSKRWGLILALIVAALGIVLALPGLVGGARFFLAALPTLVRIALLTGVAVLALLPSSLDAYS